MTRKDKRPYALDTLRDNIEIIRNVVKENIFAFHYASERIQSIYFKAIINV